jgi:DNA-binding transcriptional LysR family regulator
VELRHLRYFVAVAEMENVSRAAMQRLHVSQPSLSRQIRDLEDEIGVQLLERTAKSVRLTEAGRAFLNEARAILKQTDEAVGNARAIAGKREAELHIGDRPDHARASSCVSKSDAKREGESARLAGREKHRGSARRSLAACDHSSSAQSKRAR